MGRSDDKAARKRMHILLVEDEALIRAMLAEVLRETGFTVIEAASADLALECLNDMARLDLLFTDVQMPGSMNGIDLARRLRAHNPDLPIIISSANLDNRSVDEFGPFIAKPYLMHQAIDLVLDMLRLE